MDIHTQPDTCKDRDYNFSPLGIVNDCPTSPKQYICKRMGFTGKSPSKLSLGHS